MLRFAKLFALGAAALGLSALPAHALTIVSVGAPAINCVFDTSCTITVTDSVGTFTPAGDNGSGRLQSRTFATGPGSPAAAAGASGYEYRVDLTGAQGLTAVNCVKRLRIDFGSVVPLPYTSKGKSDVFVVTSGGLGSVGVTSALRSGTEVTFTFAGAGVCPGQTSYFFGLASKSATPTPGTALLYLSLGGTGNTDDRVPSP